MKSGDITRVTGVPELSWCYNCNIVTEFRMGCGQMDLASACVLCPLNHLVLYFKTGGVMG